jgi:23S rRNA pseudouridine1911/1915/1917 synthase
VAIPPVLPILYEDNHLLVVNKPADLPTMGVAADEASVFRWAAADLKRRYQKPGNVYLGIVSRLDRVTTGVLVLARTSKAASRLSEQLRTGRIEKQYWAVLEGIPGQAQGERSDWLIKDEQAHRMRSLPGPRPGAQSARLRYRVLDTHPGTSEAPARSFLEIELLTGRKHQIRAQWSAAGHPVWGDRKYGAVTRFGRGIALHARRLRLEHPTGRQPLEFTAPLPPSWRKLGMRFEDSAESER